MALRGEEPNPSGLSPIECEGVSVISCLLKEFTI